MEDDHCMFKEKCPSDQLIAKVPMISNRLFPLRIVPDIKGKTKTGAAFKAESEETIELLDKRKNCSAKFASCILDRISG